MNFFIKQKKHDDDESALQLNIIPLPVIMNRKIKKPPVKLNFWLSQ